MARVGVVTVTARDGGSGDDGVCVGGGGGSVTRTTPSSWPSEMVGMFLR